MSQASLGSLMDIICALPSARLPPVASFFCQECTYAFHLSRRVAVKKIQPLPRDSYTTENELKAEQRWQEPFLRFLRFAQETSSQESEHVGPFLLPAHVSNQAAIGCLAGAPRALYGALHTCTVASEEPEAIRLPSGDHTTAFTASACPR